MKTLLLSLAFINAAHALPQQALQEAQARGDYLALIPRLQEYAEQGDGQAQLWLGNLFSGGEIAMDLPQAVAWYEKAQESRDQGVAEQATRALGGLEDLSGFTADDIAAYGQRAAQGDTAAMKELALQYRHGRNIGGADPGKAREWLEKAAQAGDAQAQITLGQQLENAEGLAWLEKAAAQHPAYHYYLGEWYERHATGRRDWRQIIGHYEKSASVQEAMPESDRARIALARLYFHGGAIGRDTGKALAWLEKTQGYFAAYHLGQAWRHGLGVAVDRGKARTYYRKAEEYPENSYKREVLYGAGGDAHIASAEYALGQMAQEDGDARGAEDWYRQAAGKGHVRAQYALAQLLEDARPDEARYWRHTAQQWQDCDSDAAATFLLEPLLAPCAQTVKDSASE